MDENGKYSSKWTPHVISLFMHEIDKPARSGRGNMMEIDGVIVGDSLAQELGFDKGVRLGI
jgi:hypothetical protein